jgi:hypothetical protein
MLFVTSMKGVSPITKRNYVVESVGIIFLIHQKDVDNPQQVTREPCEHSFGSMQGIQREFSVKEMVELVGKSSQLFAALIAGVFNIIGIGKRDTRQLWMMQMC